MLYHIYVFYGIYSISTDLSTCTAPFLYSCIGCAYWLTVCVCVCVFYRENIISCFRKLERNHFELWVKRKIYNNCTFVSFFDILLKYLKIIFRHGLFWQICCWIDLCYTIKIVYCLNLFWPTLLRIWFFEISYRFLFSFDFLV